MLKRLTILPVSFALALCLRCTTPVNPYEDYNNCRISFVSPPQPNTVVFVDDSVPIKVRIDGATLFSVLVVYAGSHDSTTFSTFADRWIDTVTVKKVFARPDSIKLVVRAILKNKAELRDSSRLIIAGRPPVITTEPPDSLTVGIGAACSVSVVARGVPPLGYRWVKNGELRLSDTFATLRIGNFQPSDSGSYRCIVSNAWGADTSRPVRLIPKKAADRPVFWHFDFYRDTLDEGESLFVRIDSLYTAPSADTVALGFLDTTIRRAVFRGDSVLAFGAGARDSGFYSMPAVVSSKSGADTAVFVITVRPRYCTLSLSADSGTIAVSPKADRYRWQDTVRLRAVPDSGFLFVAWGGDVSGNADSISLVLLKDMTIQARFAPKKDTGCIQINAGSLNKAIRESSPGSIRPKTLCPAQGLYDEGTIRIWGTVRFAIQ